MRIITTRHFENQLKGVSKKYRSASRDAFKALETFDTEAAQYLGARMYKVRVLDGFFEDMSSIKIIDVPDNAQEIVLASDGYPELLPTLEESERALKEILAEDPLFILRHKSTKGLQKGNNSFDDRAYIRFNHYKNI